MKQPYIAQRDCVITGLARPVRHGERVALTRRAAKYPLIRGWIAPAPAPAPEPSEKPAPAPRARRKRNRKG